MARTRKPVSELNQLSFDFSFNETIDTIEQLQRDMDVDEEQESINDHQTTRAVGGSSEDSETNDHRGRLPVSRLSSAGLENSGSLGSQQPGEAEGARSGRGSNLIRQVARAADRGAPSVERIPGDASTGSDRARDTQPERGPERALAAADYAITDSDELGSGGPKAKFRDNIAALEVLKRLRDTGSRAAHDDQATLVRYVGWGGLPNAFDHQNTDWRAEHLELSKLLSKEEFDRARRSTQDAHYTSQVVIDGIYRGLQRIGFDGGRVLEPASGIGNFLGLMPAEMRRSSQVTAIELDPLTAEIAKHLYPGATVINRGLQDVLIPSGHFDACIGNPPFGSQSLYDPQHRELSSFSIHNYFLAKSLDKLREGGVMAFVVSRYFMDATSSLARSHIADHAHLLGAIRLPNTAFKRNALTEVTTDIVFLQKAAVGELIDRRWVDVGQIRDLETGEMIPLNQYFVDNPTQMAGRMAITSGMHRDIAELLPAPGQDLAAAIDERLGAIAQNVYRPFGGRAGPSADANPGLTLPDALKVGSFFIAPDGRIARRLPDILAEHDYAYVAPKTERAGARIQGMVSIRDALRNLMQAERADESTDFQLNGLRVTLNRKYDEFLKKFGHVSSQANRLAMSEDPEYPLLHALEHDYNKGISPETAKRHGVVSQPPSANKAAIFFRRVIAPRKEVEHVESAKDALVVSMNESGRIDLLRMVRLTGKSEAVLVEDLSGLIYLNPESQAWETSDQYLTGDVKYKLRIAEDAAKRNPRYGENLQALRAVQPADIEPIDIAIQLGSTWVPDAVVDQFVCHLLGDVRRRVTYQSTLGKWLAKIDAGDRTTARATWGTESYPANELIEAILTNRPIQVKIEVGKDEHGNKQYRLDDTQTAAANQKADEIRQAFLDWVWEDKDRRETLAKTYNDRFNTNVVARYDGSHLELPGASVDISLRPHQKDAIWRGIQDGTALFDHVVGAGKTLVCVGTIMESKRMGLIAKPMLVVPNHLLLQWKDAFYSLYPNANILVAEKSDFKRENRGRLFGRITTGDWDAVIVAHSSFKKIGMPDDTLRELLAEQIDDLTDAIAQMKLERGDRLTIKEMEKARERMTAHMERAADSGSKDQAVSFSDLGVDALFVDEAHEFKNLFINTSLSRVSGLGNLAGSEKAFDLFVKCRYLQQERAGRGVFFATGTPISNTIAELYTMQRFLQYDQLKARGIVHFDAWASTFGQVVTGWELDATGVNYRLNSRFAKFQNVPELTSMYRTFADVITKSDLDRQAEERGSRFPVPKVKGGRPLNLVVRRSEEQALFMGVQAPVFDSDGSPVIRADGSSVRDWNEGSIIHRMEHLPRDPRIDNPLKITNDARKAGLDFRLINPNAIDEPQSKVNTAVDNIFRIWSVWNDRKGTQLVFCDLSTPKLARATATLADSHAEHDPDDDLPLLSMDELLARDAKFSVYNDVKSKLIQRGVPEGEIRFIHEAATDLQKAKLFDEMNRGQVRVLLGSTAKLGAGTNVQRRLVALHHLDAPWRPSDLEQRDGRILRQGNLFYEEDPDGFEVEILRYATEQTYDSRMWQTIEYKAAGIEQFRKGDSLQRVIEDVAGEAANAAEMKAAASGNPLIFLQVQLSADLKKQEALFANYRRNQHSLSSRVAWLADADLRGDRAVARWDQEISLREAGTGEGFHFKVGERTYSGEQRDGLWDAVMHAMKQAAYHQRSGLSAKLAVVEVGQFRGFKINVYARHDEVQFVLLGTDTYEPESLRYRSEDKFSLVGFISRINNFMSRFEEWRVEAEHTRKKETSEHVKAVVELEKPFSQHARLELLRQDMREIMTELKLMQADPSYVSTWTAKSRVVEAKETEAKAEVKGRLRV